MQKKKTTHIYRNRQQRKQKSQEDQAIFQELETFTKTAWGREWVNSILESGRPYRMQRGIRYAQEDRVENLTVIPGELFATVQGTAPTPYRVKVQFKTIPEEGWKKIIDLIANKSIYLVRLLENKMPEELMDIFEDAGFSLFPPPAEELNATCSCPDQEVPCKHIAATTLYLGRVADFDPFILLKLRGKSKEDILSSLSLARSCGNRPIAQATKRIREQVNAAEFTFDDIPNIIAQDIENERFINNEPVNIGLRFASIGGNIDTLDNLGGIPSLENPEEFGSVLRELYLNVTKSMLNLAIQYESKKNGNGSSE